MPMNLEVMFLQFLQPHKILHDSCIMAAIIIECRQRFDKIYPWRSIVIREIHNYLAWLPDGGETSIEFVAKSRVLIFEIEDHEYLDTVAH